MRRHQRLERAATLQRRLHRIELAKLAKTEARMEALRKEERRLSDQLEQDESLLNLFPALVLRRLSDLRIHHAEAAKLHALQDRIAREHLRRCKQAERMAQDAHSEAECEETARERRELLDLFAGLKNVRLP